MLFGQQPRSMFGGQQMPMQPPMSAAQYNLAPNDNIQAGLSAMPPMSGQQAAPNDNIQSAISAMPHMTGQGMFGAKKPGINWGHVLVDALSGAAGQEGPYAALAEHKRNLAEAAQIAADNRAASLQDHKELFKYDQDNKAPDEPNAFDAAALGAGLKPGTPDWIDAHAKYLQHFGDPLVNMTLPNGQFYSGPSSGVAAALGGGQSATPRPVGKLTPITMGGGVGNGPGGFPGF